MSLRVYNTLTREKEVFKPVVPGKVGIYVCGPTVYKPAHIGHMVGPVIFDAIKRYLVYKGYEVTWVVNITDVDDKLIEAAAAKNISVEALAEQCTREYLDCLSMLGVDTIDRFPKASEHIDEIIEVCRTLIERQFAYAAEGNVWFDVAKDPDYGKLSNRKVEQQELGTRSLEGSGKRSPADFALWKAAKPGEPSWDSPWGRGRPGWHIECSAMSMKYLGATFDMHGGGMDLMFPHHENELAQSESATGKPFVRFWMHNGLTRVNTKKISGSDAATVEGAKLLASLAARKLIEEHTPELLRYFLLSTHYRRPIEFTPEVLTAARKGLSVFHRLFERVERLLGQPLPEKGDEIDRAAPGLLDTEHATYARNLLNLKLKFLEMMDDDFNTAGAIAVLHELAGEVNGFIEKSGVERNRQAELIEASVAGAMTIKTLAGTVLGLLRGRPAVAESSGAGDVEKLMALFIAMRAEARKEKNFPIADRIRKGLAEIGVSLEDRPEGTIWRKEQE